MFSLQTGDIVPGKRIGALELGKDMSVLLEHSDDFTIQDLAQCQLYIGADVQIWVDKTQKIITQIMVYGSFEGTFMGQFKIGSFLGQIEERLGESAYEEADVYLFESQKGICFELEDIEEEWDCVTWFKHNAPIEFISVFLE